MKTFSKIPWAAVAVLLSTSLPVSAQVADEPAAAEAASEPAPSAAAATSAHQKLCAMLGLKVGGRYVFQLEGNDEYHFWEVKSLGGNGWILAKDSLSEATWVNLSGIVAIKPIPKAAPPRPEKHGERN